MLNVLISYEDSTVMSEYKSQVNKKGNYQSEADLERKFIKILEGQAYEYFKIDSKEDFINNIRTQIENLNDYKFNDEDWTRFYKDIIANKNDGIREKTRKIQEDSIQSFKTSDGITKNIKLIDKKNVHKNFLQVINQYKNNEGKYDNRYDVTILVNGLPLVHLELKRRGVSIKEAFNQIERYNNESFWSGDGLFEYIQIFVISNGTNTKYYSNTTRENSIQELRNKNRSRINASKSFEFTNYWSDGNNNKITDLEDFAVTFFAKHTILNILTKYCVFTSDEDLLVMRPYQIVATEKIISRIKKAQNYNQMGTIDAGGYIWHTTGSGKTLTSFKTSNLISKMDEIDKVIFVVDRKDLDYQTIKEYERFEKGCVSGNKNTSILTKQLEDQNSKIIVTTIQKLNKFISSNANHPIYNKDVVMIFDECHRSQFGEMHLKIIKNFKKYYIFGFTGTPIFKENSVKGTKNIKLKTTEQVFGERLHTYTIINAIIDENVLPFKVDFLRTFERKKNIEDKLVSNINYEEILLNPKRIEIIAKYILDNFDRKTKRNTGSSYSINKTKDSLGIRETTSESKGFNSIFAVSNINAAKMYYVELKKQIELINKKLKIATIFSYDPNEERESESDSNISDENIDDTEGLSISSREFLDEAIKDYNSYFGTSFDTSASKFPNYYKDISKRMKNREIDILIVVNMFLTGFDAKTLNTLWVDKNLKMHGLLQAFSRTNRIFNSVKSYGNIVCFRNLESELNEAIKLFGDKNASSVIVLKPYEHYYELYKQSILELFKLFPLDKHIEGEKNQKEFIKLFGKILKLKNILDSFDEFSEDNGLIAPIQFQDYQGKYTDLYGQIRRKVEHEVESVVDDIEFEIGLIKQIEVDIDYILNLIHKYANSGTKGEESINEIFIAINSSLKLKSKKNLIDEFIKRISASNLDNDLDSIYEKWEDFVSEKWNKKFNELLKNKNIKEKEFKRYVSDCFKNGYVDTSGSSINRVVSGSLFNNNARINNKMEVAKLVKELFDEYYGILSITDISKI